MLRESFLVVHANLRLVLLYVAINLPFRAAWIATHQFVVLPRESVWDERTTGLVTLCAGLVLAFTGALATTIVFARLASRIDLPLRKHPGDWGAVERFYGFWLLMVVSLTGIAHVTGMLFDAGYETPAGILQFIAIVYAILLIPIGAGVTFVGNARWEGVRHAGALLGRVFDRFLVAAFLGFLQLGLLGEVIWDENLLFPIRLIAVVVDGYCDCVIFSYVFLALRESRDAEDEDPFGDY